MSDTVADRDHRKAIVARSRELRQQAQEVQAQNQARAEQSEAFHQERRRLVEHGPVLVEEQESDREQNGLHQSTE